MADIPHMDWAQQIKMTPKHNKRPCKGQKRPSLQNREFAAI